MEAYNKDFEAKVRAILGLNGAYASNDSVAMAVSVGVGRVEGDLAIVSLGPIVGSKSLSVQDRMMMNTVKIVVGTETW
ncbi:hypothetical protein EG329_006047 [Mollisiaceae sp. DMI_Dod_QoI]|nr:hypothetical protein EG329_006047 [Helotiales sp. DMI_Dod_QoI]